MLKFSVILSVVFCSTAQANTFNNPHLEHKNQNIRHAAFIAPPKTLDPARSYSSDEALFTAQIYEPPLQYHFTKRPYELQTLTAVELPREIYLNAKGEQLPDATQPKQIAYTIYDIRIKPGILYQPHAALHKRELVANDYAYQIKRLASPKTNSPIFGVMSEHIVGFKVYNQQLRKVYDTLKQKTGRNNPFLDLRQHPLAGVKVLGPYHYQIKIKGYYPQFKYWLAMPFFAPIPWEADQFYSQPGMKENNVSFDWSPVGTGPYMLAENNPNKQMVLARNPNFRGETFPGHIQDKENTMPFVDQFVFDLDKESIPRWNKFLQGYYDKSAISNDSFDQAIRIDKNGQPVLTDALKKKGIHLQTTVTPGVFYTGFNMLDDVVGGYSEKQKKLRQAIAIAIDYEEYISIFTNGRGKIAHGPIPPGIFGYREGRDGVNDVIYYWDGKAKRKPLKYAKKLLAEAGYPHGINPKTGKALVLNYDAVTSGSPNDQAYFEWLQKQFAKLGIKLNIRQSQYNRFQDKVRTGQVQIFSWGWLADYPDPENFLFLLYGANGRVKHGGENTVNYANPKADALFEEIRNMPNSPARQEKIDQLMKIVREDSPWVWGYYPIDFQLSHQWNAKRKPHGIANNTLKYEKLNPSLRQKLRSEWNKPIYWPILLLIGFLVVLCIPLLVTYWKNERKPTIKRKK